MKSNDLAETYPLHADADISDFIAQATDIVPSIIYVYDLQEQRNVWVNRSIYDHLGYSREEIAGFGASMLSELMHMEDMARYPSHFEKLIGLEDGERAQFEYRMKTSSGSWLWLNSVESIYRRNANGTVRQIIGSAHDVTDAREREIEVALMGREMSHRVQNLFSVVTSMIRLTGAFETDVQEALSSLEKRVTALSAGHKPINEDNGDPDSDVETIARRVLEAHIRDENFSISGDKLRVLSRQITPLCLILNELATNASKYGALSRSDGRIELELINRGATHELNWTEHVAEPVEESERKGFGTKLIESSVSQLGGTSTREITAQGLRFNLSFPYLGRL